MTTYNDRNVINGTYGEVWVNEDYMAESTGLEAKMSLEKTEVNMCKRLSKGYKITGTDGKGTLKMNHVSSYFVLKYGEAIKKGQTPDVSITTRLADPDAFGAEEIKLTGVIFDELTLANWELKKNGEESIPFTFTDFEVIESIPFK
ncbi:MAG: phage tail tube protein [Lachnospiraceae bacterium]